MFLMGAILSFTSYFSNRCSTLLAGGWILSLMMLSLGLGLFILGLRTEAERPASSSDKPMFDRKFKSISIKGMLLSLVCYYVKYTLRSLCPEAFEVQTFVCF